MNLQVIKDATQGSEPGKTISLYVLDALICVDHDRYFLSQLQSRGFLRSCLTSISSVSFRVLYLLIFNYCCFLENYVTWLHNFYLWCQASNQICSPRFFLLFTTSFYLLFLLGSLRLSLKCVAKANKFYSFSWPLQFLFQFKRSINPDLGLVVTILMEIIL